MDSTADILNPKKYEFTLNGKRFIIQEPTLATLSSFKKEYENILNSMNPQLKQVRDIQQKITTFSKKIDQLNKKDDLTPEEAKEVSEASESISKMLNDLVKLNADAMESQLNNEYILFKLIISPEFTKQDYMNLTPSMKKILNEKIIDITGINDFLKGNLTMVVRLLNM